LDDGQGVKTLQTYLLGQVLAALVMTVAVFTFVLVLVTVLKEVLPLLISSQVGFGLILKSVALSMPFAMIYSLPMGMLTATLLVFGRFSADQELTAVRASGVSLLSLASPILLLSLAFCTISALVNMELGPRARVAYTNIRDNLVLGLSKVQLPAGRYIKDFPGYVFYIGKNDRKGDMQDVLMYEIRDETNVVNAVQAQRARIDIDEANRMLNLTLYDVSGIGFEGESGFRVGSSASMKREVPLDAKKKGYNSPRVDDMTFIQLRQELRNLERMDFPISRHVPAAEQLKAMKQEWQRRRKDMVTPVIFHMHRQVAFSFACFGFTLVGIPLAIRMHRRETNVGIAIALGLVSLYYMFILVGQALDTRPEFAPYLVVWLPNFLFQSIGAVLLWRANRGI
jgi:lipopolysaccharide export system permease protein